MVTKSKGVMFLDFSDCVAHVWLQPLAGATPTELTNFSSDRIYHLIGQQTASNLLWPVVAHPAISF
jgi:hypothetical protein